MAPGRRRCLAAWSGVGARLCTRRHASYGHPTCRERATCVPGRGHCEPPDDRRGNNSGRGFGPRSRVVRGTLAGRIKEGKKNFCCVTTRRRNLWFLSSLRRGLGPLAARALSLGVPGFGEGVLALFGLPPCRLPAADLPQAFGLLAVALVPTPRLILAPAPFAKAGPRARSAPSGLGVVLSLTLAVAHGRISSQGKSSGRMRKRSPRALSKRELDECTPV
jgi:hypothetical protein